MMRGPVCLLWFLFSPADSVGPAHLLLPPVVRVPPSQSTWVWTLYKTPGWHFWADACTTCGGVGWEGGSLRGSSGPLGHRSDGVEPKDARLTLSFPLGWIRRQQIGQAVRLEPGVSLSTWGGMMSLQGTRREPQT